jgi:hypothetical protein
MAKQKKKRAVQIQDFFGTYNTYRIFALKSDFSTYNFANKLGKALNVSFTTMPDFDYVSDKLSARFTVFYAEYAQQESIHCLLLENRTETNQQELFTSKINKNSHLVNYSLFEESLYLFNNYGLRCFDMEHADMDYLMLLFTKKNIENEAFSHFLANITLFKSKDISYMLKREQTSAQAKTVTFLRDFLCKYEVNANLFSRRKKMELLAPVQQIPVQNLQFPMPIRLENNSIVDHLQLSEEYLLFLAED